MRLISLITKEWYVYMIKINNTSIKNKLFNMFCSTTWGNLSESNTINVNYEDIDDYDVGDEKRGGRRRDPREWDGIDMERIGDVRIGWPAVWDDSRDDAIQTGLLYQDLFVGDTCEAWYRGFWWRCTIHRRAKRPPTTVSIRMNHWPRTVISQYRPGLIRKA